MISPLSKHKIGEIYKEDGPDSRDWTLERLEREHNWYTHKVFVLPKNVTLENLNNAIAKFVEDIEDCYEDDVSIGSDGIYYRYESLYVEINTSIIEDNYALIEVDTNTNEEEYQYNMYKYLNEKLSDISNNKCPNCGEKVVGKGKFCSNCGAPFK